MAGDADQNKWKDQLGLKFPQYFNNIKVLDVGSADINGTNKPWFTNCQYVGLDIAPYKNVDVVSIAHEYDAPDGSFDVVCSTSELEHDMYWRETLLKMVKLLRPGGFMWFEAPHKCGEHGTRSKNPTDSLTSGSFGKPPNEKWKDYYKDMDIEDIRSVLDLDNIFEKYEIFYSSETIPPERSLRFWGIKKL